MASFTTAVTSWNFVWHITTLQSSLLASEGGGAERFGGSLIWLAIDRSQQDINNTIEVQRKDWPPHMNSNIKRTSNDYLSVCWQEVSVTLQLLLWEINSIEIQIIQLYCLLSRLLLYIISLTILISSKILFLNFTFNQIPGVGGVRSFPSNWRFQHRTLYDNLSKLTGCNQQTGQGPRN